ncbi:hypothetical protein FIBSPDRAFT_1039950 [Athelia psychrophila]|uniref:G domain-containing protein n=1 Tax=Athelia psychrophila TaxID=1759441 RepID=A0A166R7D0_9AGAM|nr:hypothetical protein FIBSPDRAFT_1039950 [Fibularhizoctonia sp. CBS 109695]
MSLFKLLRRPDTPSRSRASTPPFEGVQAPFVESGPVRVTKKTLDANGKDIRERFDRVRVLIIGRANAGKTTILQKVCGTTDKPMVYNSHGMRVFGPFVVDVDSPHHLGSQIIWKRNFLKPSRDRGLHDINNATVFKSNPAFIFHDSRGFESGGAQELEDVKAFLSARSGSKNMEDQLHAVWYCIPLDDDRPFLRAEIDFFSECGTGNVPVIVIFTKFDAMDDKAFAELTSSNLSTDEARVQAPRHAKVMFDRDLRDVLYGMKYPPKNHVLLRDMNDPRATCEELVTCTANAIDNEVLKLLFISTQRSELALCMEIAINELGQMDDLKMQEAIMNCFPHCVACHTFFF